LLTKTNIGRIALLCTAFPTNTETFVLNQIVGFKKMGIEVDIFPYWKCNSIRGVYEKLQLEKSVFPAIIPPKSLISRAFSAIHLFWKYRGNCASLLTTLNPFKLGKSALNLTAFYRAIPFVGKGSYDLIIAHFGENGIGAAALCHCGFLKAPLFTVFHGYDLHWREGGLKAKTKDYELLFKTGARFITNSQYSLRRLLSLGAPDERSHIIPAGLFFESFLPSPQKADYPETYHFSSIGRLIKLKGHHLVIEALKHLKENEIFNWKYTIAGEGPNREWLEKLIYNAGLINQIHLTGVLTELEIKNLLVETDIFIHPSITDETGRAEAQGLVIQEALAMGLPVIAFDSGGVKEGIPEGTGIIVEEGDVEGMAAAILELMNNPEKRNNMGVKARTWVKERYDINRLNNQLLALACNEYRMK
jgi:colanic acid/amylovoran biosynthesis glycosyltransferase